MEPKGQLKQINKKKGGNKEKRKRKKKNGQIKQKGHTVIIMDEMQKRIQNQFRFTSALQRKEAEHGRKHKGNTRIRNSN